MANGPKEQHHPGSNAIPLSKAEHDQLMAELGPIIRGLGGFDKMRGRDVHAAAEMAANRP